MGRCGCWDELPVSQVRFYNGKVLFVGGLVAMHADCCCAAPCVDCAGEQPNAEVTVTGTCTWGPCQNANGVHIYQGFNEANCQWEWLRVAGSARSYLHIFYSSGIFCARLGEGVYTHYGSDGSCGGRAYYLDVTAWVSCNKITGLLRGAFDLSGDTGIGGGQNCYGCTAHVTLGG